MAVLGPHSGFVVARRAFLAMMLTAMACRAQVAPSASATARPLTLREHRCSVAEIRLYPEPAQDTYEYWVEVLFEEPRESPTRVLTRRWQHGVAEELLYEDRASGWSLVREGTRTFHPPRLSLHRDAEQATGTLRWGEDQAFSSGQAEVRACEARSSRDQCEKGAVVACVTYSAPAHAPGGSWLLEEIEYCPEKVVVRQRLSFGLPDDIESEGSGPPAAWRERHCWLEGETPLEAPQPDAAKALRLRGGLRSVVHSWLRLFKGWDA